MVLLENFRIEGRGRAASVNDFNSLPCGHLRIGEKAPLVSLYVATLSDNRRGCRTVRCAVRRP